MDSIYFEKQEGQLCAQHCINNLLQGPYFTAVELADVARQLDDEERMRMAEGGLASAEYQRFLEQPSVNMDDTGYFSVQVISKCLKMWNLDLTQLSSPHMKDAVENPLTQRAFICNHDSHWLTIRKLGKQWINLDSLLNEPQLLSDTYLSLFLTQLQMQEYAIFVILGALPECEADQLLMLVPLQPDQSGASGYHTTAPTSSHVQGHSHVQGAGCYLDDEFDTDLAKAISVSLKDNSQQPSDSGVLSSASDSGVMSVEELRQRRILHFKNDRDNPD